MKKTLIFISLLVVMFLVSSCVKTPEEALLSKLKTSMDGGGSSGSEITCYSDSNCPQPTSIAWCEGNYACFQSCQAICINSGSYSSFCDEECVNIPCHQCDYGCLDGSCIETTEVTYIDPTSCEHMWLYTGDGNYTNGPNIVLNCGIDKIVQEVNFIQCYDNRDVPKNTGYATIAIGWLPYETQYSCIDYVTGDWEAPSLISGFCCDIKNAPTARGTIYKTTLNEDGTITTT
ncbi:MAG: hypothetical protein ABIJ20_02515 [Nanoarchaeota archaeon]|nr:hypothetical protein [Nanoarchaeota archaeon]MBU1444850.1 hypothetical protein [Nanoarchaeota archaeon]MBU2406720.1 hypothetical protein [Nanoarchaeota archaeon]MBU2420319.1 hypothetical protein [Nanoarchaeota archaeon]MBU2475288.1 hypothetical protein [Nanoarchaeota archaeon]